MLPFPFKTMPADVAADGHKETMLIVVNTVLGKRTRIFFKKILDAEIFFRKWGDSKQIDEAKVATKFTHFIHSFTVA